ncbi:CDP-glycerol glycerophosphotransferase family protein [Bacteroides thetaiotaomicron]|uniref:CDP-glycerol glycerophosphotransferase family protein n=10 Tax=Bacteroides thetaiotaomicron TaxID=818 RepID=UPI0008B6F636|nr:CDP-glycerol glycerophosphotransferase family protein [Bacteroides thetaiotaomicron]SEM34902.1 cytidyltransferase-like domain-containing protein [Bacteroides thetaiotaomicron]
MSKTVYIGMTADIMHPGLIRIINEATKYGDVIIGLLTDKAIAEHKRLPYLTYEQRKEVVQNIKGVCKVVPQEEWSYVENLKRIKPDYIIHGDDWKTGPLREERVRVFEVMNEQGGKVIEIPYTLGINSSSLDKDIKAIGTTPDVRLNSAEYYKIYVEIYDSSRISEYQEYIYGINPNIRCTFLCACVGRFFFNKVSFKDMLYAFFCFCRASKCFTATFYYDFSFKKRSQQIICLGYYTPFKDDYHMGDHSYDKFRNTTCNSFDYSIATSCLSARIISIDCGISYDKFKVLGFPRNDLLISKNNCNVIKREISKFAGYDVTKYIVYTPTFRDYETVTEGNLRSILGYVDCDLLKLSKILLKFNAALILKLHPLQNKTVLKKDLPKGILVFEQTYKYGLYDLLSFSDGMITDYTSTYFDFLLVNKPVIFNFYDIEEYRRVRGFSFEPIEFFCAGDIVYNYNELIDAVMGLLAGKDIHAEHRRHISLLMNQFQDDNSTKRICDIFLNEI